MTRKQKQIVNELRQAFGNASTFDVVDQTEFTGRVQVFMGVVSYDCHSRLSNQFEIGPRGGMKTITQEFTGAY